ncbi:MAG: cytochrome P450 [Terriglobia bacterium]
MMFYELAGHPQVMARLLSEQDAEFPSGLPTGPLLATAGLPYLHAVLDETLRRSTSRAELTPSL